MAVAAGKRSSEATAAIDYVARARALGPLIAECGDEIERRRELPERVVEALVANGIFRMLLPRSLGGGELDPLTYAAVLEELAKADGSTAWAIGQNSGCSMSAPYLDPIVAREVFGDARGILAWGPDLAGAGKAVAVEGGYRVTGRWGFATGSRHSRWLGCHVPVFEPDGSPRSTEAGRPFVRTMIFPKSCAEIIDNWQVVGLRGTGSDSYRLDDHFVPQRFTLSRDNPAERRETGPLYQFGSGMIYALSFSHVSLGIARGAFEAFLGLARDKVPRGTKRTLRDNNFIQSEVARSEARLGAARAYLRNTIREMWDEARSAGRIDPERLPQLRLASTWAIHQARDVVASLYQAAGAGAVFESNPLERRMRDIHAGTQQGQGRPLHFETVGQILLGLEPEGRMFR
jgi:alkylation response protein AidB-like acyl-CoA dehydrogenase